MAAEEQEHGSGVYNGRDGELADGDDQGVQDWRGILSGTRDDLEFDVSDGMREVVVVVINIPFFNLFGYSCNCVNYYMPREFYLINRYCVKLRALAIRGLYFDIPIPEETDCQHFN